MSDVQDDYLGLRARCSVSLAGVHLVQVETGPSSVSGKIWFLEVRSFRPRWPRIAAHVYLLQKSPFHQHSTMHSTRYPLLCNVYGLLSAAAFAAMHTIATSGAGCNQRFGQMVACAHRISSAAVLRVPYAGAFTSRLFARTAFAVQQILRHSNKVTATRTSNRITVHVQY